MQSLLADVVWGLEFRHESAQLLLVGCHYRWSDRCFLLWDWWVVG